MGKLIPTVWVRSSLHFIFRVWPDRQAVVRRTDIALVPGFHKAHIKKRAK